MPSHREASSLHKPANIIQAQRVAAKLQEAEELSGILEQVSSCVTDIDIGALHALLDVPEATCPFGVVRSCIIISNTRRCYDRKPVACLLSRRSSDWQAAGKRRIGLSTSFRRRPRQPLTSLVVLIR